ncbi:MAG: cytochrome-c peroxidase [Gemmatimonadales bacterium]|nr:cytochrome-c peroxidase [Gemmatimonadales bacterium]
MASRLLTRQLACFSLILASACADGTGSDTSDVDRDLRRALADAEVAPLEAPPDQNPALVQLGQSLMFDKVLSGNRDVSCATCHHPASASGDALSLAIGTGGTGSGAGRTPGAGRPFVSRNSPPVFNLGFPEFTALFWDGRVARRSDGGFDSPAGASLPSGVANPLAAQAMIPVATRLEMRGQPGDVDRLGNLNELAALADDDFPAIWQAIMDRVLAVQHYISMFEAAYPGVPTSQLGFQHAANAIAAFEIAGFTRTNSPFDRYLAGDDGALGPEAKQGGLLFYGKAACSGCHVGPHLTDQQFHNVGVPQLGPGMGAEAPEDFGRGSITGAPGERYQFRTPALRNVELTGPYMHDGAFTTLRAAVAHYLDVPASLRSYDASQLDPALQGSVLNDAASVERILAALDPRVSGRLDLSDAEVDAIVEFLKSLTDPEPLPSAPATVPSGLPVQD